MYKVQGDVRERQMGDVSADPHHNILFFFFFNIYIQGTEEKIQGPRIQSVTSLLSLVEI